MRTVCRLSKISLMNPPNSQFFGWLSFNFNLSISIFLWIIIHCLSKNHSLSKSHKYLGNHQWSLSIVLVYSGIKKRMILIFQLSLSTIKPFSDCLLSSKRLSLKGRKSMIQTKVIFYQPIFREIFQSLEKSSKRLWLFYCLWWSVIIFDCLP